jgi:hypothetical protein
LVFSYRRRCSTAPFFPRTPRGSGGNLANKRHCYRRVVERPMTQLLIAKLIVILADIVILVIEVLR